MAKIKKLFPPGFLEPSEKRLIQAHARGFRGEEAARLSGRDFEGPILAAEGTHKLLLRKEAADYLAEIRNQVEEQLAREEAQLVMSIIEKRAFCAAIVRASVLELPESSPLWQELSISNAGRKLRLADKLKAIQIDNELAGHNKPQEVKIGTDQTLAEILEDIAKSNHLKNESDRM